MNAQQWVSTLALASVLLMPSLARADSLPGQANRLKVISRITQSYSLRRNGSYTQLCVNGTCTSYHNCPALTGLTLPNTAFEMMSEIQAAKILCRQPTNTLILRKPSPKVTVIQFSEGGTHTNQTHHSQVRTSNSGLIQIHTHQSTLISR
jgi:hypothetical protein